MQHPRLGVIAALLNFGCLSLATPQNTMGATTKFTSSNPAFSFDLPSGWSSAFDKKGTFSSQPRGEETYNFSILDLTGFGNSKELRAAMPELAKSACLKKMRWQFLAKSAPAKGEPPRCEALKKWLLR